MGFKEAAENALDYTAMGDYYPLVGSCLLGQSLIILIPSRICSYSPIKSAQECKLSDSKFATVLANHLSRTS